MENGQFNCCITGDKKIQVFAHSLLAVGCTGMNHLVWSLKMEFDCNKLVVFPPPHQNSLGAIFRLQNILLSANSLR